MTITVRHLSKKYLLKTALDNVSAQFAAAKIHALVGENGAGKSTLASILAGDNEATEGSILLDENEVTFRSARDALRHGIVLVHQRPLLASSLSVKENIAIDEGFSKKRHFFLHAPSRELLALRDEWAPSLALDSYVKDLGGNMRFYAALLAALLKKPRCLILDEPSAFLDFSERTALYEKLRALAKTGTSIIVITHSTAEASSYADTVTLLHDGALEKQFSSAADYKAYLADKGRTNSGLYSGLYNSRKLNAPPHGTCCLKLLHASARPKNRPVLLDSTIEAVYGEISCVSGLQEAALGTLEDLVTGMEPSASQGQAEIFSRDGTPLTRIDLAHGRLNAALLRKHRTAIVPSDRTFRAAHPALSVEQMLSVYVRTGTNAHAKKLIQEAGVNITPEQSVSQLSGGMLQRLILARELSLNPDLIILCNPMQGLDVQSQGSLCQKLAALAHEGKAILIIGSADFPLSLCTRVYSLEGGRTVLSFKAQGGSDA